MPLARCGTWSAAARRRCAAAAPAGAWARLLDSWRSAAVRWLRCSVAAAAPRPPTPLAAAQSCSVDAARCPPGIGLERKDPEDWRSAGFGQARLCRI